MSFYGGLFKSFAAVVGLVLATGLFSAAAGPTASFKMTPDGNPVVGQTVQFADTSAGSPTSWSWSFGDGQVSSQQNPTHVYGAVGPFTVTLTASNTGGASQQVQTAMVNAIDTLLLNQKGSHPFTVKLTATNQHNNNVQGAGQAIPQSDVFGFFSFPSLTSNPDNPEVFVKILDGRPINGEFWVFYGHLTDLIYDLTVTEVATGITKVYHKDAGTRAPGDADTSGFHTTAATTPTPTPTPPSGSVRIVNVGGSGNFFRDSVSGSSSTTIHVGDTVKWVWIGNEHSTTSGSCISSDPYAPDCAPDGQWDSGLSLPPTEYSYTFTTAGSYKYYCQTHGSSMTGNVSVLP